VRLGLRSLDKEYDKSEDDIKALQSVGQMIGEVLKQLTEEKCKNLVLHSRFKLFVFPIITIHEYVHMYHTKYSYCEIVIRPKICGWMPQQGSKG
jgi:ATP-dependent 26S proteasome regulatory subunit